MPLWLVRPSRTTFQQVVGLVPRLHEMHIQHAAASDMVHSATCSSSASQSSPTRRPIAETPHQPLSFPLPKQWYGMKNIVYRSFQPSWFDSWTWLHYDETTDAVLCHLCTKVKILLVFSCILIPQVVFIAAHCLL